MMNNFSEEIQRAMEDIKTAIAQNQEISKKDMEVLFLTALLEEEHHERA